MGHGGLDGEYLADVVSTELWRGYSGRWSKDKVGDGGASKEISVSVTATMERAENGEDADAGKRKWRVGYVTGVTRGWVTGGRSVGGRVALAQNMGNSQSQAQTDSAPSRALSPLDQHSALPAAAATASRQRNQSPSSSSASRTHTPHRSLRYKKRSLELPDLAPRPLTPVSSHLASPSASPHGQHRRPKGSAPIPIPVPGPVDAASNVGQSPYARPLQLPSTTQMADVLPSTHIPIYSPHNRQRASYLRSQYPSTRSFLNREVQPNGHPQIPSVHMDHDEQLVDDPSSPFVAETIRSTIPVGLVKPSPEESTTPQPRKTTDEPREPVPFQIAWHGGGKSVFLARAGDANWKGRLPMEKECVLCFLSIARRAPTHLPYPADRVLVSPADPDRPSYFEQLER